MCFVVFCIVSFFYANNQKFVFDLGNNTGHKVIHQNCDCPQNPSLSQKLSFGPQKIQTFVVKPRPCVVRTITTRCGGCLARPISPPLYTLSNLNGLPQKAERAASKCVCSSRHYIATVWSTSYPQKSMLMLHFLIWIFFLVLCFDIRFFWFCGFFFRFQNLHMITPQSPLTNTGDYINGMLFLSSISPPFSPTGHRSLGVAPIYTSRNLWLFSLCLQSNRSIARWTGPSRSERARTLAPFTPFNECDILQLMQMYVWQVRPECVCRSAKS